MSDFAMNAGSQPAGQKTLFGHPYGLYVLFFTELWERFSFYGMKTLLLLYMINHFFWSQEDASHLLGTYSALAYGVPVLGGFIADRFLGAKRAVLLGGILLSIGHIIMAYEVTWAFYTALGLIIAGVGFLKPNVSTQVGSLYKPGDPRRDGAFTIFYMGINVGALIGPLLCDWLRLNYGYSYGFGAAGVGMILGLIVYAIGQRKLVEFNQDAGDAELDGASKPTEVHPPHVVADRVIVLVVVFAFVILFWTAFEQSPNAMLVWADKHTNLNLASSEPPPIELDGEVVASSGNAEAFGMTSGQTQSFNPFFIIALAPVFAWFWIWLDKRGLQPSTPTKMALGLLLVAVAFGVMWPAALSENGSTSAPLAALPEGVAVEETGQIYTIEDDDGEEKRVRYGAGRLKYDASANTINMFGVLPDLDRFNLLAAAAQADFKREFLALVKKSEDIEDGDENPLVHVFETPPADFRIVGDEAAKVMEWDAQAGKLTITDTIQRRAQTEFLAMAAAPRFKAAIDKIYVDSANFRVSVWWLVLFFMVLTCGELCLSPVGLSLVTKLAPAKHVGLLMGGWFLATAVAEYTAQVFGAYWGKMPPAQYFLIFVVMCGAGAFLLALLIRVLKRKMHGVH